MRMAYCASELGYRREKLAAIAMLTAGQATVAEIARLVGASRQSVRYMARQIDVKTVRDRLLRQQWAAALEVEDHKARKATKKSTAPPGKRPAR
jgi:transposase-like protein